MSLVLALLFGGNGWSEKAGAGQAAILWSRLGETNPFADRTSHFGNYTRLTPHLL